LAGWRPCREDWGRDEEEEEEDECGRNATAARIGEATRLARVSPCGLVFIRRGGKKITDTIHWGKIYGR
jgi:hypothetical protein